MADVGLEWEPMDLYRGPYDFDRLDRRSALQLHRLTHEKPRQVLDETKQRATRPNVHIGPRMAKMVKQYDACWKLVFPWSCSVARPTCITVSTKAMKIVATAILKRLLQKRLL